MNIHMVEVRSEYEIGMVSIKFNKNADVKFYNGSGLLVLASKQSSLDADKRYANIKMKRGEVLVIEEGLGISGEVEFTGTCKLSYNVSSFIKRPRTPWGLPMTIFSKQ